MTSFLIFFSGRLPDALKTFIEIKGLIFDFINFEFSNRFEAEDESWMIAARERESMINDGFF